MLTEITIENLAIVDKVRLRLDRGFNVLTGETGAGKSIIIDAVEAVLGGRCSADMIRAGKERAVIEALFENLPQSSLEVLMGLGIETGEHLVITREIAQSGRSVARINGRLATLAMLRQVTAHLVDIHGQGEHQMLLDTSRHLDLLDSFSGTETVLLREQVKKAYAELQACLKEHSRLSNAKERARTIDLLSFQIQEIDEARLNETEETQLLEERKILGSALRLMEACGEAYSLIYEGQRGSLPAIDQIQRALHSVQESLTVDSRLRPTAEALEQAAVWVEESSTLLRNYRELVRPDPERLNAVEDRISFLAQIKRKYGDSVQEILRWRSEAQKTLDELLHADERSLDLLKQVHVLRQNLAKKSADLSARRRRAATEMSSRVSKELADLGMKNTKFEANLSVIPDRDGIPYEGQTVKVSPAGIDTGEFLISPNLGEPLKSLTKIASGGEMSRVMLALKSVLARADRIPTLIFDEVDAGVGGQTAYTLGEKLAYLGAESQVLCVTHLAQIASYADRHIVVFKGVGDGDRTVTEARQILDNERIQEVSRMLGGGESQTSLAHAKEMLERALDRKTKMA